MKSTIASIVLLATLLVWFGFFGESIPYKSQKEGWAFSDGESGTPIPKDGADGKMNAFTISDAEQAEPEAQQTQENTTAQGKTDFPISVSVEKQTAEKPHQTQEWEIFLCGVGVGALIVEIATLLAVAVYWLKSRMKKSTAPRTKSPGIILPSDRRSCP